MIPSGSNLMIAAAIDFAGHGWPEGTAERMAGSLELGKGGKVSRHPAGQAILLSRSKLGHGRVARSEHGAQVLFAGYLQDRKDLRQRLGLPLDQPLDDGELYAAAHARWGEDCDRQVTGHYAAILWFSEKSILRAARSPMDPSPLHWWSDGTRLVIASTPRAIFAAGVQRQLDDAKLDAALIGSFANPTQSWFAGISRLEGGTAMTWRGRSASMQRFWSVETLPDVRLMRDEDYVEALDALFTRASAEALDGFSKPGLLLSGGLDSQAVASYALDAIGANQTIDCYTSVPAQGFRPVARVDTFPDERPHVEALEAMHPRLQVTYVEAAGYDFTHRLSDMFVLGSVMPMAALNMHWIHDSLVRAASASCDVMLTGAAGNASFSYDGDTAFAAWLRQGRFLRLFGELGTIDLDRPFHRRLMSWALMPNLPLTLRARIARLAHPEDEPGCPLRTDYMQTHGLDALADAIPQLPARSARQARNQLLAMGSAEAGDIELGLELLHGLPFRDPTAYRPMVEFCAGIPDDQYRHNGVSRGLARRLLKGRIPEAVRLDKRVGQQAADWPLRLERSRPALLDELSAMAADENLANRFDLPRITDALHQWDGRDARASKAYEKVALASSRAIMAARFIRFANGSNQ
jgi:asparagine synthase (glutamine-hydrolysing)